MACENDTAFEDCCGGNTFLVDTNERYKRIESMVLPYGIDGIF